MSNRPVHLPLIAAAVLALLASAGAMAQDGRDRGHRGEHPELREGDARARPAPRPRLAEPRRAEPRRRGRDDNLADSVRRIERTTRGRVINAERVQSDGRNINRIKVMDDRGRIRVYMDDPSQRRGAAPTRGDDN